MEDRDFSNESHNWEEYGCFGNLSNDIMEILEVESILGEENQAKKQHKSVDKAKPKKQQLSIEEKKQLKELKAKQFGKKPEKPQQLFSWENSSTSSLIESKAKIINEGTSSHSEIREKVCVDLGEFIDFKYNNIKPTQLISDVKQVSNYLGQGFQAKVFEMIYFESGKPNRKGIFPIDSKNELQKRVAVKVVKFDSQIAKRKSNFYRELRSQVLCLGHSNIVNCFGAGSTSDMAYMVLERCSNVSLKSIINCHYQRNKNQYLDTNKTIISLLTELCDGCTFMSRKGVLHRDLTIANVLVETKENLHLDDEQIDVEAIKTLKLADFGVSAIDEDKNSVGRGSMRHQSPEAISDKGNYTSKSDVFSFGLLMLEIFEGKQVYDQLAVAEACSNTTAGIIPDIPKRFHSDLVKILEGTWKFNPDERLSFEELYILLKSFSDGLLK